MTKHPVESIRGDKFENELLRNIKPITPAQVIAGKPKQIHPGMIRVLNILIANNYNSQHGFAVVLQSEIVDAFLSNFTEYTREQMFREGHLNFESTFTRAGWRVEYDKPCAGDQYEPKFIFRPAMIQLKQ